MGRGCQWEYEEVKLLKRYWAKYGPDYIAAELERSPDAVTKKATRLGLTNERRNGYTKHQIKQLRRYAGKLTAKEIAKKLNKTKDSVSQKAYNLKISLRVNHDQI